jgi:hypothetical protein
MYPRSTGHTKVHYVPETIVSTEDADLTSEELEKGLQYLRSQSADLIYGDLVAFESAIGYRNEGLAIFDGEKIINLDAEPDDYGTLPEKFHVITNGVPIDYWHGSQEPNSAICHNTHVWFDPTPVLDQCLANIQYSRLQDQQSEKWAIFTTFEYEGRMYRIILDLSPADLVDEDTGKLTDEGTVDEMCQKFRRILESPDPILFYLHDIDSLFDRDDYTLFV